MYNVNNKVASVIFTCVVNLSLHNYLQLN